MNEMRDKEKVKTYCYGELREFPSVNAAMAFYLEGCAACDGAERDRFLDIYSKLACGTEPYCDCDGVPAVEKDPAAKRVLTEEDEQKAREIVARKREVGKGLDSLRAEYDALKAEFDRKNAALLADIRALADEHNDLFLKLLKYEKLGFRA